MSCDNCDRLAIKLDLLKERCESKLSTISCDNCDRLAIKLDVIKGRLESNCLQKSFNQIQNELKEERRLRKKAQNENLKSIRVYRQIMEERDAARKDLQILKEEWNTYRTYEMQSNTNAQAKRVLKSRLDEICKL